MQRTHTVIVKTSLSGFDVTAAVVMGHEYMVSTLSACSAPAVWLHVLLLHICSTNTRCSNHMMMSNPKRDVFTTALLCVLHTLPNALLV